MGNRVYKYCAANARALENLRQRQLYCRHPLETGNPFDFIVEEQGGVPDPVLDKPRFLNAMRAWGFPASAYDAVIAEQNYLEYFESLTDSSHAFADECNYNRVASLTSRPDNIGLWTSRAVKFSGFCLAFDASFLSGDSAQLLEVQYVDRPPMLDHLTASIAMDVSEYEQNEGNEADAKAFFYIAKDLWNQAFSCKPRHWEHEQEIRLLVHAPDRDREIMYSYPAKALKEVMLGSRMAETSRREVQTIISEVYGEIPIRTAAPAPYAYRVEVT